MIAWNSILILSGIMVGSAFLSGCTSSGKVYGTFETPLMRITLELDYYQISAPEFLDLDVLKPKPFLFEGKEFFYYPTFGGIFDADTGELFQLEDPSWEQFKRLFPRSNDGSPQNNFISEIVDTKGSGQLIPMWDTVLDPSSTEVSISVQVSGDMVFPTWDVERWPTLDRRMFIFPDGIEGSPDPMNISLSGEASDVFGYLAEFGLLTLYTCIDGSNWDVVVSENDGVVDVFVDDTLVTSFLLLH